MISHLMERTKSMISSFLITPHELKNLKLQKPEIISRIKNRFQTLVEAYKSLLVQDVSPSNISLREVCESTRKMYLIEVAGLQIIDKSVDRQSEAKFYGVKEDIENILRNLLHNSYASIERKRAKMAVEEHYEAKIEFSLEEVSTNPLRYRLLFSDNGTGLSPGTTIEQLSGQGTRIINELVINRYRGKFNIHSCTVGENSGVTFLIELESLNEEKNQWPITSLN